MKFVAFERSLQGTGASRRLRNRWQDARHRLRRRQGPAMIELDHNALYHA
jgi:large subunit ribosomal protein L25